MTSTQLLDLLDPKFPLIYRGLLPSSSHFQMTKSRLHAECCICERPFTVFFWTINGVPYKTLICQICAKIANVCQVSILDLDIGIPVIVRNKLLHQNQEDHKSSTARWYGNRMLDRKIESGEDWYDDSIHQQVLKLDHSVVERVQQMVRKDPYLSFKKAPVCKKFLSDECTYGESCYFSHELPGPGECSPSWEKYGVRGRYLGTNDPNGTAIIEKLLLIDQSFFQQYKENHEDKKTIDYDENDKLLAEELNLNIKEASPMTHPFNYNIFDNDEPIMYKHVNIDNYKLPNYINGVLK